MSSVAVSYFNENRFPLTSKIIPTWFNYQGLSTSQKIVKVFKDLFKTIIFCTGIIPAATATIDFFIKKKPAVIIPSPVFIPTPKTLYDLSSLVRKASMYFLSTAIIAAGSSLIYIDVNCFLDMDESLVIRYMPIVAGISVICMGLFMLKHHKEF